MATCTALLLAAVLLVPPGSLAHRCYVCLSNGMAHQDALHLFPGPPKLQYCDQFRPGDPRFIRECPPEYTGCLTQIQGNNIMRMCSDLPMQINDCKPANNIQYCYCYGEDLCNFGNSTNHGTTSVPPHHLDDEEDDDFPEGSGSGTDDYHRKLHATNAPGPYATTSSSKDVGTVSQANRPMLATYQTLFSLITIVTITSL